MSHKSAPSAAVAFVPMLVTLWAITHRYQGFARDGELYAVQALARIEPQLGTDLYLQYTSQDHYTFFSPIYAAFIRVWGLQGAEQSLFLACSVWFLAATWALARRLWDGASAWLVVALFIITIGYYGAYQIFSYSESYLTARSLAEALVVTSLACHFHGWRRTALAICVCAMFIHPLMALPGLLLLACLRLPMWAAVGTAGGWIVLALLIALAGPAWSSAFPSLRVLDPAWLEVVRERSQFLFLKYWTVTDWEVAARPFVCLTLAALVTPRTDLKGLCIAAMLVGASGLAISYVACTVGPVALLLQGQAWRWDWVTGFVSVLMIVPTAMWAWKDERCGPLCALLLVAGWTYPEVDNLACTEGALLLWLLRDAITPRISLLLRWATAGVGLIILVTVLANCWRSVFAQLAESGREAPYIGRLREAFRFGMTGVLLVVPYWFWMSRQRAPLVYAGAAAVFIGTSALMFPGSIKQLPTVGTRAEIEEFKDWREAIPANSSVLVIPATKSASFAWFTLGRPSYLSVDQSAGVVFSPATAQEVRRRSEVLLPVSEPDWQILTQIEQSRAGTRKKVQTPVKLTAAVLSSICRDSKLGFVIAAENVGFEPLTHHYASGWNNWNLYDCRRVRGEVPAA